MKVAIFSESSADEAAIRILVEGLLGRKSELPSSTPRIHSRGWSSVLRDLSVVLKHLHFQTDAEALVVVLDSDRSHVHDVADCESATIRKKCRLCQTAEIVADVQDALPPMDPYGRLKTGLGLAVPQVEAWYLAGRDPHVSEAAWIVGLQSGQPPYTSQSLKVKVYGTDDPSLERETTCAKVEARRIVDEGKLPLLEQRFPAGFGALANDVRNW